MKQLISTMVVFFSMNSQVIFDFKKDSNIKNWSITDDVVMGGRSNGSFSLSNDGLGVFEGNVSLKNNGGFSMIRYNFSKIQVKDCKKIVLKLKGDGKKYQFRIRANSNDYFSYIYHFSTTGEWQEIEVSLKDMYPSFRGRKLNQPNFHEESIEEIAFLIGNKKKEEFKLLLEKIECS